MKLIKEACEVTGLTKKAISTYEKHGLLEPIVGTNKYRKYSKENIDLLNKISKYKSFGFRIKQMKIVIDSNNNEEIINKTILENQYEKHIEFQKQKKAFKESKINSTESKVEELLDNISVNFENSKEVLRKCIRYINKIEKLDELFIITQYSINDIKVMINKGIVTPRLASYIMDCIKIDIQVLIGARKLTHWEENIFYIKSEEK